MHHDIHGFNEKIEKSQKIFKELPPKIETMADLKEYLMQYLFKKLQLDGEQNIKQVVKDLADKNSVYAQTLIEEGVQFLAELAVLYGISNDTGWQGLGTIRQNQETKIKYFDPDIANVSRLIGEDVMPELINKIKQTMGE